MLAEPKIWLRDICKKNSFIVSDYQLNKLEQYVENLIAWNTKVNLISRRDIEYVWQRQILPSVSFLFRFHFESNSSILDLGTGGGLPGIPLAILQPSLRVTLLDSVQKKIRALNDILSQLQIHNVITVSGRAEEVNRTVEMKETFDYIIARSVASILEIVQWGLPFLKVDNTANLLDRAVDRRFVPIPKGSIVMLKGGDLTSEIQKSKMRFPKVNIVSYPLVIDGQELLVDKKIVLARNEKE